MKSLILLFILTFSTHFKSTTDYCNGWRDGYRRGYCNELVYCPPKNPPFCEFGGIRPEFLTYQNGYERGFLRGLSDRK
jgi:hypothetical protein